MKPTVPIGLKGTLSPPMKREISLLVLLACPTNRKKLSAQHIFCIFSLLQCRAGLDVYVSTFMLVRVWTCGLFVKMLTIKPAACDGRIPEMSQIELEKQFCVVTLTEQGAIYRLLD